MSQVIDDFHRLAYDSALEGRSWGGATYFGHKLWKWPGDLQLYQELIWEVKPHVIVETGSAFGGSALFYAHLMDQIGWGKVISVDLKAVSGGYPKHPRIAYLGGRSSTSMDTFREVQSWVNQHCEPKVGQGACVVVLDSDHSKGHVLTEMNMYSKLVTPNSWMIVEDVNVNGHPVYSEHGPGPREAVDAWLPGHPDFKEDETRAGKYLFSMHAWLRRRRS